LPNLYPVFETPELVEQAQPGVIKYGQSWEFDFNSGQFVKDGGGKLKLIDGHSAWVQWCIKAILTQRYAYLAYSKNYGFEQDAVRNMPDRKSKEAEIERCITEALLADPRTEWCRDFNMSWGGESLTVSFSAKPKVGPVTTLEVKFDG